MARSRDGSAAIEFALLAIPYFVVVFAIIETFVAYTAEQVLVNAVDTMGRKLRTGELASTIDRARFRTAFCQEIAIMMACSAAEIDTPSTLHIDLQSFKTFRDIPTHIPRVSEKAFADIDTSQFSFRPGGPDTINMLRAYYRWQVKTDLVRPYITNIRPSGGSGIPTDYLIIGTSIYKSEAYPKN